MIYIQKWSNDSFEYKYLKAIEKAIKDKPDKKIYIGFDYGFFYGMNIYYGSNKDDILAKKVYDLLKKHRINIRLLTNLPCDFDVVLLLGYTNQRKERYYLSKNKDKIVKALSFF